MEAPALWAITRDGLTAVEARLKQRDMVRAAAQNVAGGGQPSKVGIVPIFGTIGRWPDWWNDTSTAEIGAAFDAAMRNPNIGRIVLAVDSPGGAVGGVTELANKIFNARGTKPITAVSDVQMASAALWIASAADEIVVAPSSETGSIGVYARHVDRSAANEKAGVCVTYVAAGEFKVEGNPDQPLSAEALASLQADVKDVYRNFVKDVARFRGTLPSDVMYGMGKGRVLSAQKAVASGLADRVGTLEDVLAQGSVAGRGKSAAAMSVNSDLEDRRRRWRNVKRRLAWVENFRVN
jgi:capsid assembly protease